MKLRPYQQDIITKARGKKSAVIVAHCGSGKTVVAGEIARLATAKNNKVLFLAHRQELITQAKRTFNNDNVDFYMVQTFRKKYKTYAEPKVIIIDETHLNFKAYKEICDYFPNAVKIGLTATPVRLGQGGLGDIYTEMVESVSTRWLIDNSYLADYKYYSVKLASTDGIHTRQGDYAKDEIAALMQNDTIYGETVKQWQRLAEHKKTIVYCASIKASMETAEEFIKQGYRCKHVDGASTDREKIVDDFKNGDLEIICNVDLFGVGFDVPDCECVVLLRPTQSLALFIQQSMRSMRYKPNKTAIILDHVGNCYRFGLPDDSREWTLESKRKQENIIKIKECPNCYAVYEPSRKSCPYCGDVCTIVKETKGKTTVDVDLVEVERVQKLAETRLQEFKAELFEDVVEYQQLKGYKFGWVLRFCKQHRIPIPKKYNFMMKKMGI